MSSLPLLCLAAAMLVLAASGAYAEKWEPEWAPYVEREFVFTAGATLMGLVAFGALLNVWNRQDGKLPRKRELGVLFGGAAFTALASFFLMYAACCYAGTVELIIGLMSAIFAGVLLVLLGNARIVDRMFKQQEEDSSKGK